VYVGVKGKKAVPEIYGFYLLTDALEVE